MQLPPVDRTSNWRPPGADLYSTGASGAVPVRPINPVNPTESLDHIGGGVAPRGPDKPSAEVVQPNRDWTIQRKQETAEEPPEPPKEPISKQLLEFLQAMWRAGGAAILEGTEEAIKAANNPANASQQQQQQQPLTYSDPKVKKTSRL